MTLRARREDFRHEALFYAGEDEFLEGTGFFIRAGLEADEPVMVVLRAEKIEALCSELNGDADRVLFADMDEVGSNPARIIPAWREFVDAHSAPGRLRGIGEPIWAERSPAELVECQRHESLLNLAFANTRGFHLLCPYDTRTLDPDVLEEARRSHPSLASPEGARHESSAYRGLDEIAAPFAEPLPDPPAQPEARVFQAGTLRAVRQFVGGRAANAGFGTEMIDDLVLAVNELATNSVLYGRGGVLRTWQDGDALICEVSDTGLIEDPLVGRERPALDQPSGYGVWLANQLCDLVQVRSFAGGSTVRLHKRPR